MCRRPFYVPVMLVLAWCAVDILASRQEWADSPEAHFMTADERRAWAEVKSDDEATRFIQAFRSRRRSNFQAIVNERAAIVDERLALGEVKASSTVRGRIVMLLGAPTRLTVRHIPKTVGGNVGHPLESRKGGATDGSPKGTVAVATGAGWVEYRFEYAANPALGIGHDGWTIVSEADASSGKDRLKFGRDKKKMEEVLDTAARKMLQRM
jgi:hypothetical protein